MVWKAPSPQQTHLPWLAAQLAHDDLWLGLALFPHLPCCLVLPPQLDAVDDYLGRLKLYDAALQLAVIVNLQPAG